MLSGRPFVRGSVTLTRGVGCPECRGTGFRGRLGVFELLVFTDEVRDAITQHASRSHVRSLATQLGLVPLRADGWGNQAGAPVGRCYGS